MTLNWYIFSSNISWNLLDPICVPWNMCMYIYIPEFTWLIYAPSNVCMYIYNPEFIRSYICSMKCMLVYIHYVFSSAMYPCSMLYLWHKFVYRLIACVVRNRLAQSGPYTLWPIWHDQQDYLCDPTIHCNACMLIYYYLFACYYPTRYYYYQLLLGPNSFIVIHMLR